jgi:hypothetical protein
MNHSCHPRRRFGVALVLLLFIAGLAAPVRADDAESKQAAVAAIQAWLKEMDAGQYGQSWTDAAGTFQKALTSQQWVATANAVRTQLGKCSNRTLASALAQTQVPSPAGVQKGNFVVAQFDSSFENLKYAIETVCAEKTPDGSWKVDGYYIKPKS